MLKISVFKKIGDEFVFDFVVNNIEECIEKMRTDFGENHSRNYEIEIERI